jgi:hypothetical protein
VKRIFVLLMVVVVLSPAFLQLGVVAYFQFNKNYIQQQLCINKNNPKSNCKGHCYLTKQLKKAEEGERKQSSRIVKEKEEIISNYTDSLPLAYFPNYTVRNFVPYPSQNISVDTYSSLLKPPAV